MMRQTAERLAGPTRVVHRPVRARLGRPAVDTVFRVVATVRSTVVAAAVLVSLPEVTVASTLPVAAVVEVATCVHPER